MRHRKIIPDKLSEEHELLWRHDVLSYLTRACWYGLILMILSAIPDMLTLKGTFLISMALVIRIVVCIPPISVAIYLMKKHTTFFVNNYPLVSSIIFLTLWSGVSAISTVLYLANDPTNGNFSMGRVAVLWVGAVAIPHHLVRTLLLGLTCIVIYIICAVPMIFIYDYNVYFMFINAVALGGVVYAGVFASRNRDVVVNQFYSTLANSKFMWKAGEGGVGEEGRPNVVANDNDNVAQIIIDESAAGGHGLTAFPAELLPEMEQSLEKALADLDQTSESDGGAVNQDVEMATMHSVAPSPSSPNTPSSSRTTSTIDNAFTAALGMGMAGSAPSTVATSMILNLQRVRSKQRRMDVIVKVLSKYVISKFWVYMHFDNATAEQAFHDYHSLMRVRAVSYGLLTTAFAFTILGGTEIVTTAFSASEELSSVLPVLVGVRFGIGIPALVAPFVGWKCVSPSVTRRFGRFVACASLFLYQCVQIVRYAIVSSAVGSMTPMNAFLTQNYMNNLFRGIVIIGCGFPILSNASFLTATIAMVLGWIILLVVEYGVLSGNSVGFGTLFGPFFYTAFCMLYATAKSQVDERMSRITFLLHQMASKSVDL